MGANWVIELVETLGERPRSKAFQMTVEVSN